MANRVLRFVQKPAGVFHFSVFHQFSGGLGPSGVTCDSKGNVYVGRMDFAAGPAVDGVSRKSHLSTRPSSNVILRATWSRSVEFRILIRWTRAMVNGSPSTEAWERWGSKTWTNKESNGSLPPES